MNVKPRHGQWISVADLMPPTDGLVLIHAPCADEGRPMITTAWYDPRGYGWSLLPPNWIKAITHWMPLPEPPKESA